MNITVTLFAQVAAFALLVWLVNRLLWGPLTEALEKRRKKIADGLAAGEEGQRALEESREQAEAQMTEARAKAAEVMTQAERRAASIVEQAKHDAREESDNIKRAAEGDLERQRSQAGEALRREAAALAIKGVERVLARGLSDADHEAALKELEARI